MTAGLQIELRTYQANLQQMLTFHEGEYVVIYGAHPVHFSSSYENALDWAYDRYGAGRFFVKRVAEDQAVAHFTRDLGPCRA